MSLARLRRILVGMDAFGHADGALNAALDLVQRSGASLRLLHAVPPHQALRPDEEPTSPDEARRAIELQFEASLSGARVEPGFLASHLLLRPGAHAAEVLLDGAREWGADLLVLGRPERRSWIHPLNTVRSVLARSPVPVWVQIGKVRETRRILVPVDLGECSAMVLRAGRDLARLLGAELLVLHAFQAPAAFSAAEDPLPAPVSLAEPLRDEARGALAALVGGIDFQGVACATRCVEDPPHEAILALEDDVDLVLLGSAGLPGLAGALLGSVAEGLIRGGSRPLLVLAAGTTGAAP